MGKGKIKIGILGTRGIPNHYGGFEQFAESLSVFLASKGYHTFVYCSSSHFYKEDSYQGVNLIHCVDPEEKIGTAGQFLYDFNCIMDARKRNFDIILQLGYTSNSIWWFLLPKNSIIITNMDGLEWKRDKYSSATRSFLKYAEKLAVKSSDCLVSDSKAIAKYLQDKYKTKSKFIAYGSEIFDDPDESILVKYGVKKYQFNMLIARFEPENNFEMILDGVVKSKKNHPFLVIGNYSANNFGKRIKEKYKNEKRIVFLGENYIRPDLDNLRCFSNLYFHGHSVGGTNPSLIEAMGSKALVIANDNEFNKSVLKTEAFYFKNEKEVSKLIEEIDKKSHGFMIDLNIKKIENYYNTKNINTEYLDFFNECIEENKKLSNK